MIDRGKPKGPKKNLSQCQSVHHKSHKHRPGHCVGKPAKKHEILKRSSFRAENRIRSGCGAVDCSVR
jgi:hypothetical protein